MTKRDGVWSITDEGRNALRRYPTSEKLRVASGQAYAEWRRSTAELEPDTSDVDEIPTPPLASFGLEDARERSREAIIRRINTLGPYELQDLVAALLRAMGTISRRIPRLAETAAST